MVSETSRPRSRAFLRNLLARHALAVVAHLDHDGAALVRCRQGERAVLGLPTARRSARQLDTMIQAVAHQVGQRVGDFFDQAFVQLGGLTQGDQSTFCPACRQVAQHAREAAETMDMGIMRIDITDSCRSRVLRSRSARPASNC